AAPAEVEHAGAVGDGVVDGRDGVGGGAGAAGGEEFDAHDLGVPGHAGQSGGVVSVGADDAGTVRAVTVVVIGGAVVGVGVEAVCVVDDAVAVVVDAVVGDLTGIDPEV